MRQSKFYETKQIIGKHFKSMKLVTAERFELSTPSLKETGPRG